ncbi:hypothetical protein [Cronobacter sakazakii]|uniref:hypothetical protein n=1 Tax=Cronobacter sakazakii TaxID=28141 RepID=UPI001AE91899|nr:hypothetical protein [Cronobacter sakazakii]
MLESLKEYLSSTINTASQRVSNPVFGAFALSWCAFNWKSILYLFLSDTNIADKIAYISDHSSWKTVALYPCLSVAVLCGCLPWINNVISAWQAKPLDNNDSIENHRKAKQIIRSTRLRRLEAKRDVTYERVRTGDEINIQQMKEQITQSQERMGEITAEKDMAVSHFTELSKKYQQLKESAERFKSEAIHFKELSEKRDADMSELSNKISGLMKSNDDMKRQLRASDRQSKDLRTIMLGQPKN